MTERQDEAAAARPTNTGEFRATPDISANTAQFQAFADNRPQTGQWNVPVPARSTRRMTGLIVAAAVVLLILIVVIAKIA
jgi:hypothetical protein